MRGARLPSAIVKVVAVYLYLFAPPFSLPPPPVQNFSTFLTVTHAHRTIAPMHLRTNAAPHSSPHANPQTAIQIPDIRHPTSDTTQDLAFAFASAFFLYHIPFSFSLLPLSTLSPPHARISLHRVAWRSPRTPRVTSPPPPLPFFSLPHCHH